MYMSMRDECIERALSALSYSEVCAEDPFIPAEQICADQAYIKLLANIGLENIEKTRY